MQRSLAWYPASLAVAGCDRSLPFAAQQAAAGRLPAPDPLTQLLKRTRFGISADDHAHAVAIGMQAYVDEQLAPESLDGAAETEALSRWPLYELPEAALYDGYASSPELATQHLAERTLFLATYSARQLFELTVEFWTNHFSIENLTGNLPMYKMLDDRLVVRANASGRFRDLLFASARSPAMLEYLDTVSNVKGRPNQNYARELMELHTLGVAGGYTEQDVNEVARCFTGWSINPATHTFEFVAANHDDGEKTVLGQPITRGGVGDGEAVLELLAAHPATARFIATKLTRRFVADDPPAALVDAAATAFRLGDGEIPLVLRAILLHADFAQYWDRKVQRPIEYIAGAVRALAPASGGYYGPVTLEALARMGQIPHHWFPPDGFPDQAHYWLSGIGLIERWNFAAALAEAENGVGYHAQRWIGAQETPASLVEKLATVLLRRPLLAADRDALIGGIVQEHAAGNAAATLSGDALKQAAMALTGVLIGSPYFTYR